MPAGRLVSGLTVGTGVVGGEERTDDELSALDGSDLAADFLNDAAVFMPHRGRLDDRADAAVWPQVRTANAGGRDPDDGICRLEDRRLVALLEAHVARCVQHSSSHRLSPLT